MERSDVEELHFITSVENLPSIMSLGILCNDRAAKISHRSVASESVQGRRRSKSVPNAARLHSYANLYFDARNPMMYKLLSDGHKDLIVIRVAEAVLDIPGAVLTDGNSAADGTRFYPSPEGLANLDGKLIYARYWTDGNSWPVQERKRARNAEVLIPEGIHPGYIIGCYVDSLDKKKLCQECEEVPAVSIHGMVFFNG